MEPRALAFMGIPGAHVSVLSDSGHPVQQGSLQSSMIMLSSSSSRDLPWERAGPRACWHLAPGGLCGWKTQAPPPSHEARASPVWLMSSAGGGGAKEWMDRWVIK